MDAATQTMIANLKAQTGKSLEQWVTAVTKSGRAKHGEIVSWLKSEHGVTHGYANLIAHMALKSDAGSQTEAGADLIADAFSGDKAAMRPVYDAVIAAVRTFGGDIEYAPKKGYMSLRRKKQFATVHASTKTRVDVGIQLKGVAAAGRLELAGSWNAMMSHRVRLESVRDVDAELVAWLKQAYEGA